MKDKLSALIDGEFELDSATPIITAAKSGGELRNCWQHYHLIGDAMRGDQAFSANFCDKVMHSIDAEPTVLAVNKQNVNPKIAAKKKAYAFLPTNKVWSIAASVAAVMFVGLMVLQQQLGDSEDLSPIEIANSVPMEYLQAHQSSAPSGSAYYIQTVGYPESNK